MLACLLTPVRSGKDFWVIISEIFPSWNRWRNSPKVGRKFSNSSLCLQIVKCLEVINKSWCCSRTFPEAFELWRPCRQFPPFKKTTLWFWLWHVSVYEVAPLSRLNREKGFSTCCWWHCHPGSYKWRFCSLVWNVLVSQVTAAQTPRRRKLFNWLITARIWVTSVCE